MLKRIEVLNFKSIAHADLDLSPETVIVGVNGAGKSNLLDAVNFLRDAAVDNLDHAITKRHGIGSIRRWSKTKPFNVTIKLHFVDGSEQGDYRVVIASSGGDFSVIEEEGNWLGPVRIINGNDGDKFEAVSFKRNSDGKVRFSIPDQPVTFAERLTIHPSELLLSQLGGTSLTVLSIFFSKIYEQIASCGAYSIYPNKIREPQSLSSSEVLSDDGTNLASIIRQMRATSSRVNREALTQAVRQVLPIVSEIQVRSAGGFYVPIFRVLETEDGHPHDLNMSQISDGTLRMLGMLTAFYQPKAPNIITLEEPEQMIHPGLLPVLMDAARDYVEEEEGERQIVVTTHSPNLLDLFRPEDIISAVYEAGVSHFSSISSRQLSIIKDNLFSAGELLVREGIIQ